MLIWRMVLGVRFPSARRCVTLSVTAILANQPNFVMSDRRKNFFRWLISVLFCCWNSSTSSTSAAYIETYAGERRVIETIEMGPLSLREYVNTLEPYDPEKHGWRGEEPWGYREKLRRQIEDLNSSCDAKQTTKSTFNGLRNNCHYLSNVNHIACNETAV